MCDIIDVCVVSVVMLCVCVSGCPPLQGAEAGEQNFMGVLETAMKLANQDAEADDDEEPAKVSRIYETDQISQNHKTFSERDLSM